MITNKYFKQNLADSLCLGVNAFDISLLTKEALNEIKKQPGHYTYKTNPLACKKTLHKNDFYYCDTLIEPYCSFKFFNFFENELIGLGDLGKIDDLLCICKNAFVYGRFHRDFKLNKLLAENRYCKWLEHLYETKSIYTLYYANNLAGFIAYDKNKLVLHALSNKYRGKGLAKYFWSKVCKDLFAKNYDELISSVSAANLIVINLYSSLGFKFRNPVDVYHRLVNQ